MTYVSAAGLLNTSGVAIVNTVFLFLRIVTRSTPGTACGRRGIRR